MLNNFCESLGLPACESDVLNQWHTYVYQTKSKPHLFIEKLIERFLHDDHGPVGGHSIDYLKVVSATFC